MKMKIKVKVVAAKKEPATKPTHPNLYKELFIDDKGIAHLGKNFKPYDVIRFSFVDKHPEQYAFLIEKDGELFALKFFVFEDEKGRQFNNASCAETNRDNIAFRKLLEMSFDGEVKPLKSIDVFANKTTNKKFYENVIEGLLRDYKGFASFGNEEFNPIISHLKEIHKEINKENTESYSLITSDGKLKEIFRAIKNGSVFGNEIHPHDIVRVNHFLFCEEYFYIDDEVCHKIFLNEDGSFHKYGRTISLEDFKNHLASNKDSDIYEVKIVGNTTLNQMFWFDIAYNLVKQGIIEFPPSKQKKTEESLKDKMFYYEICFDNPTVLLRFNCI